MRRIKNKTYILYLLVTSNIQTDISNITNPLQENYPSIKGIHPFYNVPRHCTFALSIME